MKMYVQKTIRFDQEDAEKLSQMATEINMSFNALVVHMTKGFLANNSDMFPLKEDPEKQKKGEEIGTDTPDSIMDMSKLTLDSGEGDVEW